MYILCIKDANRIGNKGYAYGKCTYLGGAGEKELNADKLVKITFEFNFISRLSGSQSFHSYCGKMRTGKKPHQGGSLLSLLFFFFFFLTLKVCDDPKKVRKQNRVQCFKISFPLGLKTASVACALNSAEIQCTRWLNHRSAGDNNI